MPVISCEHTSLSGKVRLPASKSISNRLLILQELSGGRLHLSNLSKADDTLLMAQCLSQYRHADRINTDNAGTVMRFMTALLAVSEGEWILEGSARMHQRPIGPLVEALRQLGARITYAGKTGYPPLSIGGTTLHGGTIRMDAGISSQYLSALLMIAPGFNEPLTIELQEPVVSEPYIDMTVSLMKNCGLAVGKSGNTLWVKPSEYKPARFHIENDWSAAAFFYALAALADHAMLELPGLQEESCQGDAIVRTWFERLGVRTTFSPEGAVISRTGQVVRELELDFSGHPDLFLPLIAACAGCGVRLHATGLQTLAHKESDRLRSISKGLSSLGFDVKPQENGLMLLPGEPWKWLDVLPVLSSMGDHRLAMTYAVLALRFPEIPVDDLNVVTKSFPGYVDALRSLGFDIRED